MRSTLPEWKNRRQNASEHDRNVDVAREADSRNRVRFCFRHSAHLHVKKSEMKNLWLALALFVGSGSTLFGNGGAWQTGIQATGNTSASKNDRHTDVTIENEMLKIDLHPEYADVTVRYRMHNTGTKVQQDFFFPVERWGKIQTADEDRESDDINHYQISIDGKESKSTNVAGPKEKSSVTKEEKSKANQESSEAKRGGKKTAPRKKVTARQRKKALKRLRDRCGKKKSPQSSHGKNRSSLLSGIKRAT